MLFRCVRLARLSLVLGFVLSAPASWAQSTEPAAKQLYDDAFKATYDAPHDVEAAIRFAKVAASQGDLEGAVGALERVLLFNPELSQVAFELGMLYRALGSQESARIYLRQANPAQLSAEDRAIRDRTLAELDDTLQRHRVIGAAALGLRYQTNANAGAVKAAQLGGGSANPALRAKADTDVFAAVTATHIYDTGDLAGDTIETRLSLYGNREFHRHLLNTSLAELDTGPRFRLDGPEAGSPTIRPYVLGNIFELGGNEYFWTGGGGVNGRMTLLPRVTGEATVEMRQLTFNNTSEQSTASNKDAQQVLARLAASYTPTDDDLISGIIQGGNYDARTPFETYQELLLTATYFHKFAAPWTWSEQRWGVSLGLSHANRWYARPDIALDPAHTRADSEWDLGGALIIGLAPQVDFRLEVQQIWANSNVALYEYRNTAVLGSIELRF